MPVSDLTTNLPWQNLQSQSNAFSGLGQNPQTALAGLGQAYQGNYSAALGLNAALSSGTQTGYQNLRGQLDKQYSDISTGYQNLYGDVLGRIAGTNQTNLQDINAQYDAFAGSQTQSAINNGLGNSTIAMNMQRGVQQDRERALTASQNQFAQLGAGYASSIGAQGLQSQQAGAQTQAGLGQDQLHALLSTSIPYPNAGLYSNLAQMYGANQQRTQDQQRADQLQRPGVGFAWGGGTGVGSGAGNNTPFRGPSAVSGMGGGMAGGYGGGGLGSFGGFGGTTATYQPPAGLGFSGGNYDASSATGGWVPPSDVGYGGQGLDDLYSGGPSTGNYDYSNFMG